MSKIYKNWWMHNLIAHPLMQFIQLFNERLAIRLHDITLPEGYESD